MTELKEQSEILRNLGHTVFGEPIDGESKYLAENPNKTISLEFHSAEGRMIVNPGISIRWKKWEMEISFVYWGHQLSIDTYEGSLTIPGKGGFSDSDSRDFETMWELLSQAMRDKAKEPEIPQYEIQFLYNKVLLPMQWYFKKAGMLPDKF